MLVKPDAPKPRTVGVRVWPRAIPQFNIGHLDKLDKAKKVGGIPLLFWGEKGGGKKGREWGAWG